MCVVVVFSGGPLWLGLEGNHMLFLLGGSLPRFAKSWQVAGLGDPLAFRVPDFDT